GTLTESAEQPAAKFWEDFDAKQKSQKVSDVIRVAQSSPVRPLATPPVAGTRASYPVARSVVPQRVAMAPGKPAPAATPIPVGSVTAVQMRSLGNEIADGRAGALDLLEQLAKDLYQ